MNSDEFYDNLFNKMSYEYVKSDDENYKFKANFYFNQDGFRYLVGDEYWETMPTRTQVEDLVKELLRDGEMGLVVKSLLEEDHKMVRDINSVIEHLLELSGGEIDEKVNSSIAKLQNIKRFISERK